MCSYAMQSHEINGSQVEGKSEGCIVMQELSGGQRVYFSGPFT